MCVTASSADCPTKPSLHARRGGLALIVCLLGTSQALGQVGEQRFYVLAGNDRLIWILDRKAEPATGKHSLSIGVRPRPADAFYMPALLRGMVGKVRSATAVGMSLHVFFDKGSHQRYQFSTPRGLIRRVRSYDEHPIPGAGVPVALAGHSATESLYVIIERNIAAEMLREQNRLARDRAIRDAAAAGLAETEQEPEFETLDVDTVLGVAQYFLGRYRLSRWEVVGPLPEWFDLWKQCHLAIDNVERVHVLFSTGRQEGSRHAWFEQGAWSQVGKVEAAIGLSITLFDASKDGLLAAGLMEATDSTSVVTLSFDGVAWTRHPPLDLGTESEQFAGGGPAIAPFGDSIGLAALNQQQQLLFGLWPAHGGAADEPFAAVQGLGPRPRSKLSWEAQSIAAFVVLGSLLMYVFLRRGPMITTPADLPAQFVVASYWRRLVAFAIDLLPSALATAKFWADPLAAWMQDYNEVEPEGRPVPPLGDDLLMGWLIACAVYVLYCTICEACFASTPGKLTVRCRVVDESGHRCRLTQILLRNVLRFVELFPLFQLWPSFILMLFTRNRQRLGDLIARSIVVERVPSSRSRTQPTASQDPPGDHRNGRSAQADSPPPPDEQTGTR